MPPPRLALGIVAALAVAAVIAVPMVAPDRSSEDRWELVVLGIAQDAGIPHLGCTQALCVSIRNGERRPERVASLGLVNEARGLSYIFDATPDFPSQVHSLTGGRPPDGVFLTHGHIGHYTGLMYLGRESIDAKKVRVYATPRMSGYLRDNGPWSQLVSRENIVLLSVAPGETVDLGHGLRVSVFDVPHRDEFTDTVGFLIGGPNRKALFIPDIDQWQRWGTSIRDLANTVDYAFVDGTFADSAEIPGRSTADIPHPLMPVTRALLGGVRAAVWFIHINHTNQQIDADDVVKEGMRFPM
ncbi:MAG TPA: MBL fold metallo-hydrolase [Vicinamibacterales bacterium]|nr:MBL fold metallo-hydrolase [Vicinamibacterales bacterium]